MAKKRHSKDSAIYSYFAEQAKYRSFVLELRISLKQFLRDFDELKECRLDERILIEYFAHEENPHDKVADAFKAFTEMYTDKDRAREKLYEFKQWLLEKLKNRNSAFYKEISEQFHRNLETIFTLILRTGRTTYELKDTFAYAEFIETMRSNLRLDASLLLEGIFSSDVPSKYYKEYLYALKNNPKSLEALKLRLTAAVPTGGAELLAHKPNLAAALCYFMIAKSNKFDQSLFDYYFANNQANIFSDTAVMNCIRAADNGEFKQAKINLLDYVKNHIQYYKDRLNKIHNYKQPCALFTLLKIGRKESHQLHEMTRSYDKLVSLIDPNYESSYNKFGLLKHSVEDKKDIELNVFRDKSVSLKP